MLDSRYADRDQLNFERNACCLSSGSLLEMSELQENGTQTAHNNKHIFLSHRAEDEVNLGNHYFCTDSFLLKGRTRSVEGCLAHYLSAACSKHCPAAAPLLAAVPSSCPFPALPTSLLPQTMNRISLSAHAELSSQPSVSSSAHNQAFVFTETQGEGKVRKLIFTIK